MNHESQPSVIVVGPPLPLHAPPPSSSVLVLKSKLFDGNGKLVVSKMLDVREKHQSGTSVRSERILAVDTKSDEARTKAKATEDDNLSIKEQSH